MKNNSDQYFNLIQKQMAFATDLKNLENKKELGTVIYNDLFDLEGPRIVSQEPSEKSKFIGNVLFKPYSEIIDSIENIKNIVLYIRRFPFRKNNISKVYYLKYHIENYLNELYILKGRLIRYLKIIDRAYKNSDNYQVIYSIFKPQYPIIKRLFNTWINIRGIHIHEQRYSDNDITRLTLLEILLLGQFNESQKEFLGNYFNDEYKKIRKKWRIKIEKDLESINSFMETYFESLIFAISKDNLIQYPPHLT